MKIFRTLMRKLYKYRGTGLPRVAEWVRRLAAKASSSSPVVIDDFWCGLRFNCYLNEHMGSQIYWRGAYSGDQLEILKKLLKPDDVFLDIGANQGEFSIVAASLVGAGGTVYAFEPDANMCQRLKANAMLNGFSNITIEMVALSDKHGMMKLYSQQEFFEDGTINAGLFTLYPHEKRNKVVAEVPVTTLDAWAKKKNLERVDLIKLDIEGAELPALLGGENLIMRFKPSLIIELNQRTSEDAGYSIRRVVDWLCAHNYELHVIEDEGLTRPLENKSLRPFQNILALSKL